MNAQRPGRRDVKTEVEACEPRKRKQKIATAKTGLDLGTSISGKSARTSLGAHPDRAAFNIFFPATRWRGSFTVRTKCTMMSQDGTIPSCYMSSSQNPNQHPTRCKQPLNYALFNDSSFHEPDEARVPPPVYMSATRVERGQTGTYSATTERG